jgi:hypothetical protein
MGHWCIIARFRAVKEVFDPLVSMTSLQSLGYEQRAFEKLQASCDQFAQRLTATAGGACPV